MPKKIVSGILDSLSIDCLVFGFQHETLEILLVKHAVGIIKGQWALPGGWIRHDEDIDESASRILTDLTGVSKVYLDQLRAFGEKDRYPSRRVITIAYFALIKPENYELHAGFTASDAQWFPLQEIPRLPYDHNKILDYGFRFLQHKVRHEPIGFNLLPRKFTLLQLQKLYEALLQKDLDKPNFRRKLFKMNLLVPSREKQKDVSHRAANLYQFDRRIYKRLSESGLIFEL